MIDKTVVPLSSPEMAQAVAHAFNQGEPFGGAKSHLKNASKRLSEGAYADSIRESIHAVESVSKSISPGSSTLGPALNQISETMYMHPALKKAFSSLYGYTSDEEGIRHAMVEGVEPKVTEEDALYMLGSCASFVSYLAAGFLKIQQ